jgi:hypothetical protein
MPLCGLMRKSIICIWTCINLEFVGVCDTLWTKLLNGTLMGVKKKEFSQKYKCIIAQCSKIAMTPPQKYSAN